MKPSIPRGTRDFGPAEMLKRRFIFDTIRKNFELFGFQPIETPAMENISTLTGKYGEEGDQLIFKILNSRIHESKNKELLKKEFELSLEAPRNSGEVTERALRYDLTVPFARYVVMNQASITFPFKRYQMQPVWRADKPQKGRYREFYQCDADVIGSNSLLNELELISLIDKVFSELNVPVTIKLNNRKVLAGIAEAIGTPDRMIEIATAIDKVDKIEKAGVDKELSEKGFTTEQIRLLFTAFFTQTTNLVRNGKNTTKANNLSKLNHLKEDSNYSKSPIFLKGLEELEFLIENTKLENLELDFSLARGLNYYTGTIFEVQANEGTLTSSILGGGRYDDLTGIFGLKNMSGVGISFGIDRIYDVMDELGLLEKVSQQSSTKVVILYTDQEQQTEYLKLAAHLRSNNISCEIYPEATKKISKQFEYAEKNKIPFVCRLAGETSAVPYELKKMGQEEATWEKMDLQNLITALQN